MTTLQWELTAGVEKLQSQIHKLCGRGKKTHSPTFHATLIYTIADTTLIWQLLALFFQMIMHDIKFRSSTLISLH